MDRTRDEPEEATVDGCPADGSPADGYPADRYPDDLVAEDRAADGTVLALRPIRVDDDRRLREFHDRLSSGTVYLRFFSFHPHLSDREAERFTHVDYADRLALVAEVDGELVGVGRYDRVAGTEEAEVAFVVADDFQHRGIGHVLLRHLMAAARRRGIRRFVADTLSGNAAMMAVFMDSGFQVTATEAHGTVHVTFPIVDRPATEGGPAGLPGGAGG